MEIPTLMQSIVYDTRPLNSASIDFFTDAADEIAQSAVELPESDLLECLCRKWQFWTLLAGPLGLPDPPEHQLSVQQPFVTDPNQKPGDIDVLVCNPEVPADAVAIEAKRVKVRRGEDGLQKITKLEDFKKGIPQVNALAKKGFSRTYLLMIAVVDGRDAVHANFFSRGVEGAKLATIVETPGWDAVREEVGIVYVEVVQTTPRSIEHTGMICAAVLKPARVREQSGELSNLLRRFFLDKRV